MLKSWLLFALQKSFVVARNFMRSRRKEVNKAINIVKKLRFSQLYLIFIKKYVIIYMVEENYAAERHTKPLNAPAAKRFFFYYIIFFYKNQVKAREFDIFEKILYNYNRIKEDFLKPQKRKND
jgi:hypothetical protein